MKDTVVVLAMVVLAAGFATAADPTEVLQPVHQFVDSFNKGDAKATVAACADTASVIDDFPPHEWQGAGACAAWLKDYQAYAKKNGITDFVVTLDPPRHVDVSGDRAYAVIPANYTFKEHGKPMKQTGSTFIFALQKRDDGWRIAGWAWGDH